MTFVGTAEYFSPEVYEISLLNSKRIFGL